MSNVNAYYAGPVIPQQAPVANLPQPVVANASAATPPAFNADAYQPYLQAATQVATKVAPYAPGAVAGAKAAKGMGVAKEAFAKASRSRSMKVKSTAGSAGRGAAFGGIMKAVRSSVIFNGILSLAVNSYKVYKKQQDTATGGANVVGDVASAAVGGAAGAAASAAGTAMLAGVLGTGLPLTLVGIGLGVVGYLAADTFFRKTTFFQNLKQGTHDVIAKVTG